MVRLPGLGTPPACTAACLLSPTAHASLAAGPAGSSTGDGASGEVFEAVWQGKRVALKLFRGDRSPDGHCRDEMALAIALQGDRNLVKILAQLQEPLGLVMQVRRWGGRGGGGGRWCLAGGWRITVLLHGTRKAASLGNGRQAGSRGTAAHSHHFGTSTSRAMFAFVPPHPALHPACPPTAQFAEGRPLAEKPNLESLLRCRWALGITYPLAFILKVPCTPVWPWLLALVPDALPLCLMPCPALVPSTRPTPRAPWSGRSSAPAPAALPSPLPPVVIKTHCPLLCHHTVSSPPPCPSCCRWLTAWRAPWSTCTTAASVTAMCTRTTCWWTRRQTASSSATMVSLG